MKNVFTRMMLLAVLMMGWAGMAFADSKIYLEDFKIAAGETLPIPVMLDNDDPIIGLQFDVELPAGLTYESIVQNTKRALARNYTVNAKMVDGKLRVTLLSRNLVAIPAGKGEIVTIELTADESLALENKMAISNIVAGGGSIGTDDVKISANESPAVVINSDLYMEITPSISVEGESSVSVKEGDEFTLDFVVENDKTIYGIQGDIVIPEGFEIVPGIEGDYIYTDRIPAEYAIADNVKDGIRRFVISSIEKDAKLEGTEGTMFSIQLKATKTTDAPVSIEFKNLVFVGPKLNTQSFDEPLVVTVEVAANVPEGPSLDLNEDGKVTISDVQIVLDAMFAGEFNAKYDLNKDGKLSVSDVQVILDAMFADAE